MEILPILNKMYSGYKSLFNKKAVISYSGGKDSTILLYIYQHFVKLQNIPSPILFHLDHGIRENKSQEEEIYKFMKSFSYKVYFYKKNIPLISKKIHKSIEETGRWVRYKLMEKISIREEAVIVTGHHSMDYLESVLIHFIRGGGDGALRALPIYKNNRFRPLLALSQTDLMNLLNTSKFPVFEDETNSSNLYLRNRIRKDVVPLLTFEGLDSKKLYDNFHSTDLNYGISNIKLSYVSLSGIFLNFFETDSLKKILDVHLELLNSHPIKKTILMEIFNNLQTKKKVYVENSEVIFWKSPSSDLYILRKSSSIFKSPRIKAGELYWNSKKMHLPENSRVGVYRNGLKIQVRGQSKEVSELFRVHSIPEPIRNFFPLIFIGSKLVYIPFELWDERKKGYRGDKV